MTYDWRNVCVPPETPIKDVLKVIDREALRVALVVKASDELVGIVSDGDVRRGLIREIPLDAPVSEIMNPSPTTAHHTDDRTRLLSLMSKRSLACVPLIDDRGHLVGLETLQHLSQREQRQNPVFLMAGGFGRRLRPLTDNCPKPMLQVSGRPILEIILNRFIEAGFQDFYISTHYLPEMIQEHFGDGSRFDCSIRYVHEEDPLGTGGALGLLPKEELPNLPLIMMNGDILTKVDFNELIDYHTNSGGIATMCVRQYEYQVPYGVVETQDNKISRIREKPSQRYFINAGIYVISPELLKGVTRGTKIDMPTLLERHIEKQGQVNVFPIHESWLDIGSPPDFAKAQQEGAD